MLKSRTFGHFSRMSRLAMQLQGCAETSFTPRVRLPNIGLTVYLCTSTDGPPPPTNIRGPGRRLQEYPRADMDAAIDLSDASKALDLANIRFELMYEICTLRNHCRRV